MTPWLVIVGMGDDGLDGLTPAARALVEGAEVLVGGARHQKMLPDHEAKRLTWARPLEDSLGAIAAERGRRVVVLATGDPMDFGIGVTLGRAFNGDEMLVVPAPGAFSLACARLGWPLQDVTCLTLHGRSLAEFALHVAPGARLLIMSEDGDTPARVAVALVAQSYGQSTMAVLCHMGGPLESRRDGVAADWNGEACAALNVIAVTCAADDETIILARTPGLPDDAFLHDGQLTKSETRAVTLAALKPLPGQHLWDLGAGSGAIAIEWLRAADRSTAQAVERHGSRAATIAKNACRLGVPRLEVIENDIMAALPRLADPDAIFIGGGLTSSGLVAACLERLGTGGRVVANAVTVAGEAILLDAHQRHGGNLVRIAISRAAPLGGGTHVGWRALAPVTQWSWTKR
ncbi:MAG: precorrin-6y C5,15-methyltransferase (decarboxylating) subunit CbiE [Alphaproteobacteria bacterium]